jgi:hypothetical protein
MTSLGKNCYVGTLHYKELDPPPPGTPQDLQQVTDNGNTTTNPISTATISVNGSVNTAGGAVNSGSDVTANGNIITEVGYVSGNLQFQSVSVPGAIPEEYTRGSAVSIRPGTASGVWSLPTGEAGNHFWFINSSGNSQRITGPAGGTLDGLSPPDFINFTNTAPFCIKLICIRGNQWYSSNA